MECSDPSPVRRLGISDYLSSPSEKPQTTTNVKTRSATAKIFDALWKNRFKIEARGALVSLIALGVTFSLVATGAVLLPTVQPIIAIAGAIFVVCLLGMSCEMAYVGKKLSRGIEASEKAREKEINSLLQDYEKILPSEEKIKNVASLAELRAIADGWASSYVNLQKSLKYHDKLLEKKQRFLYFYHLSKDREAKCTQMSVSKCFEKMEAEIKKCGDNMESRVEDYIKSKYRDELICERKLTARGFTLFHTNLKNQ